MMMRTGFSRRLSLFDKAFFTRLFKWIVTAFRVSDGENEAILNAQGNETPRKTFLYRGRAAQQFLRSPLRAPGIELSPAALEIGLLRLIVARPRQGS